MIQMNNNINSQDRVLKPLIAIAIIQSKIIFKKINSRTCRIMGQYRIICDPQDWCLKEEN
jgi:hypothetical protein